AVAAEIRLRAERWAGGWPLKSTRAAPADQGASSSFLAIILWMVRWHVPRDGRQQYRPTPVSTLPLGRHNTDQLGPVAAKIPTTQPVVPQPAPQSWSIRARRGRLEVGAQTPTRQVFCMVRKSVVAKAAERSRMRTRANPGVR